ncbi:MULTISPECIES: DUF6575 domain-containing protein [Proteus]|uniref:DUF6575 domain-containing protein n=1 Tax=Proteus TaxID=583 RepID=UPI000BFE9BCE|nr:MULTISPECIES: DUF6575 domain-containing protein [Proteus]ATN00839.1 hypothetical protein CRN77_14360 [Proteus vulgaris]AYY80300.1 hypothetical protein EGX81_05215 [Proteus vulgaris]MBG3092098.1 hypothetical protein [Proteus terrae subsp. cibarius]WCG91865.1 hypothetical protein ONR67_07530 [Proteus terrae]
MKNIFISHKLFGNLIIRNVYEFYDEPRLFSVANTVASIYLVYWIGDSKNSSDWFIIPISPDRLEMLERKRIDIYSALTEQEQSFFYTANISFEEKPVCIKTKELQDVYDIALPRKGLYISSVVPMLASGCLGQPFEYSTHEIHVEKSAKKSILGLNHVSSIFDAFDVFYQHMMKAHDIKDKIRPVAARPGSFILSFQAEKLADFEPILNRFYNLILNRKDIKRFMVENGLDFQSFFYLLNSVIETGTNFELKNTNTNEVIFDLTKSAAEFYLKDIRRSASTSVSGEQVPQADMLETVFKVVEKKWSDNSLDTVNTGLSERHIYYYLHASKILGFIDQYRNITVSGQQLIEADDNTKLKIAAKNFEQSHCCWAWIQWAEVNNLSELDPDSAEQFLKEQCFTLSSKTLTRRSRTLRSWCLELKKHYITY